MQHEPELIFQIQVSSNFYLRPSHLAVQMEPAVLVPVRLSARRAAAAPVLSVFASVSDSFIYSPSLRGRLAERTLTCHFSYQPPVGNTHTNYPTETHNLTEG